MDATIASEKVKLTDIILKNIKSSSILITTAVQIALLKILSNLGVDFKYCTAKSTIQIGDACISSENNKKQDVLLATNFEKQHKSEESITSNGFLESILQNNFNTSVYQQDEKESSELVLLQLGKSIDYKTITKFESGAKNVIQFPPQKEENGLVSFFKLIGK